MEENSQNSIQTNPNPSTVDSKSPTPQNQLNNHPETVQTPPTPQSSGKKKWPLIILLAFIFLLLIGGASAFYIANPFTPSPSPTPTPAPQTPTPTSDPTAGWQTYTSDEYKFTFKYPADWTVNKSISEGGLVIQPTQNQGGETIVLYTFTENIEDLLLTKFGNNVEIEEKIFNHPLYQVKKYVVTYPNDPPGYGAGMKFNLVIIDTPEQKILFEDRTASDIPLNQITSTFQLLEDASILPIVSPSLIPSETKQACPADALICPDGSSVGRTGLNCEFTPCPPLHNQ